MAIRRVPVEITALRIKLIKNTVTWSAGKYSYAIKRRTHKIIINFTVLLNGRKNKTVSDIRLNRKTIAYPIIGNIVQSKNKAASFSALSVYRNAKSIASNAIPKMSITGCMMLKS